MKIIASLFIFCFQTFVKKDFLKSHLSFKKNFGILSHYIFPLSAERKKFQSSMKNYQNHPQQQRHIKPSARVCKMFAKIFGIFRKLIFNQNFVVQCTSNCVLCGEEEKFYRLNDNIFGKPLH